MGDGNRDATREAMTDLILTLFRVNNLILTWGDRLVAPFGLTSARWQILGAIVFAERPQPVAWLARDLGANRQNVQRIVNDMKRDGLVGFEPNPHHRRAQLVVLTEDGRQVYRQAMAAYHPAVDALANELEFDELRSTRRVLALLRDRLTSETDGPV
ncbi:MAG TPA: MarR family winged helix-turn-helix transcriptional regulator [Pseudorhizobium sp.]|jgi:DNA-binding MarR family transcriptional regulator|nr:MarR family winged helix-turn-helix transcriptional regulator [Pseudorhizobium sp.]